METDFKICTGVICKGQVSKPLADFRPHPKYRDGVKSDCYDCEKERSRLNYQKNLINNREKRKEYNRNHSDQIQETSYQWYIDNREYVREERKQYYQENKEDYKIRSNKWKIENPDRYREIQRDYKAYLRETNPGYLTAINAKYRAQKLLATVSWSNLKKIEDLYIEAKILQEIDNIPRHVDHIIPLIHPLVCGLHVETNLQILTCHANWKKNNFFEIEYIGKDQEIV